MFAHNLSLNMIQFITKHEPKKPKLETRELKLVMTERNSETLPLFNLDKLYSIKHISTVVLIKPFNQTFKAN